MNIKKLILNLKNFVDIQKEYNLYTKIMKKLNVKKNDLDMVSLLLRRMQADTRFSTTLSCEDATQILNNSLPLGSGVEILSSDIVSWLESGLLRGEKKENGEDTQGRKVIRYNVLKEDVENLSLFLGIAAILEVVGLRKRERHPDTNAEIIVQYTPVKQFRLGLSKTNVELISIVNQLKNKKVVEYLTEAINEIEEQNKKVKVVA